MQGIYAYMEPGKHIYIGPIYMFAMFICVYMCFLHAAYMQMSENWCKCILHCTSMRPPMRRVALNSM